jgi:hypothetical protein
MMDTVKQYMINEIKHEILVTLEGHQKNSSDVIIIPIKYLVARSSVMTKTFTNGPIESLCKCGECNSHTVADCINKRCYCCDLEDMLAILANYNAMEVQK